MNRFAVAAVLALTVLACEGPCRKAPFTVQRTFTFDDGLDGWAPAAVGVDGVSTPAASSWTVAAGDSVASCGAGALAFRFESFEPGARAWVEQVFTVDTSRRFSLNLTYDFGSLDVAGAQGWTLEASARTAEAFDSPDGVKAFNNRSASKDDGNLGVKYSRRDETFNLEASPSGRVWVRLGLRGGAPEPPRMRTYRFDHLQVSAPEPRP